MIDRRRRAVIVTFGVLGCFYVASIAAAVISVGPLTILDAAIVVPGFAVLLPARATEAVGCLAIAALSFGSGPRLAACVPWAVVLAAGGVVLLLADALTARSASAALWSLAAIGGIALHVRG